MKIILNHLKENWIKYGFETIVIIIGILGAYSLNSWNEVRKEKIKEIELLVELKDNLTEDIKGGRQNDKKQTQRINDIEKLIEHLEAGHPDMDTLAVYFKSAHILEDFEVNYSAYETLKSIGLEKLSSKAIKKEITRYYDVNVQSRSSIIERLNIEHRTLLQQILWEHRKTYLGPSERFRFFVATEGRLYINYLHSRISWLNNFRRDFIEPNIGEAQALVRSIEDELAKLKN